MKTLLPYLPYIHTVVGVILIVLRKSMRAKVADRLKDRGMPIMLDAMSGKLSKDDADKKLLALAKGSMWVFGLNTLMLWLGILSIAAAIALLFGVFELPLS